jgi:hypothetical protein
LVTTATRLPDGNGCHVRAASVPTNSAGVSTVITPAWPNNASRVTEGAAAAVWDAAAHCAASLVPVRTAITSFVRTPHARADRTCGDCRLQIQRDRRGGRVLLPPHQQIVAADVVLVPCGHRRQQAQPQLAQLFAQRDADATGLDHQPDPTDGRGRRRERRVQTHRRVAVGDADTVGPGPTTRMP